MNGNQLTVTEFAKKHRVSRMTVLRRIREGELPATRFVIEKAHGSRPIRYEWQIAANAKFEKYQAGRPPKALEIEKAIAGEGYVVPRKRRPAAALAGTRGAKVVSIFSRRGAR